MQFIKYSNKKKEKEMHTNIFTLPINSNKFLKACEENLVHKGYCYTTKYKRHGIPLALGTKQHSTA